MTAQKKLVIRLSSAVLAAFAASMVLTWFLHDALTSRDAHKLIECAFQDVEGAIRETVNARLVKQAMAFRDALPALRERPEWKDPVAATELLRKKAQELSVDELCVSDEHGILTHSATKADIGFDFFKAGGQAAEFTKLLDDATEITQSLQPNSRAGEMIKYVGVWLPEGGFVQVGCREANVRRLSRSAITGLTHNRHVSGDNGYIVITTANGTIISHLDMNLESGLWKPPDDGSTYWQKRTIEGFPVYVVIPKKKTIVERRVLVGTSAFLNGAALVFAAILVGFVIAQYVHSQLAAQRKKEMKMAADIQESAIPRIFPPFPDEKRIDIFADMKTAKDVGGDFYDFYLSAPSKITFLVADVSDKGVPAALFMMRAKTTIKGISQTGKPVAEVATEANDALSQDNGANMFVTAWIGELDLETGVVTFVNAGHNAPVAIRKNANGEFDAEYLSSPPGLVLGAMPGVKYSSRQITLSDGDMLYLYTDGITEQPDERGRLFGEDGLLEEIKKFLKSGENALNRENSPLAEKIFSKVQAYGLQAGQADDCTQLVVRYRRASGVRP